MGERALTRVGVVGCGTISGAYLDGAARYGLDVVAVADLDTARAAAAADRHGARALSTEELVADPGVDVVLNLTRPDEHVAVGLAAIEAGRHVYSEKPLAIDRAGGGTLLAAAADAGVRLGVAPDTFLATGIQTCRAVIDRGDIGAPVAGFACMAGPGPQTWHPAPEFYFRAGGGPLLDMGPYYLTALVVLLGPVRRVSAAAGTGRAERTIGAGPRAGTAFPVEVATHVAGTLEFVSGAVVTLVTSFEVWASHLPRIEIYGTEGTLAGPDPNRFAGPVRLRRAGEGEWRDVDVPAPDPPLGRGVGLGEMARAIAEGRPHRASAELGMHVLDAMCALLESAERGRHVELASTCARPAPFTPGA